MQTEKISHFLEQLNKLQKIGIFLLIISLFVIFIMNFISGDNFQIPQIVENLLMYIPLIFLVFVVILSILMFYMEYKKRELK